MSNPNSIPPNGKGACDPTDPESIAKLTDPIAFVRRRQTHTALHYAKLGFAVTPAKFEGDDRKVSREWPTAEKKPLITWSKKAVENGITTGPSVDPDVIRGYFNKDEARAICIHTGHFGDPRQSQIIAIDCDRHWVNHVRHDGTTERVFVDGYRNLLDATGGVENLGSPFVSVGRVQPGKKGKLPGVHLIYVVPDQGLHKEIRTLGGKMAPGVDLRGGRNSGGLVVESNGWHEKWRWLVDAPDLNTDDELVDKHGEVIDLDALTLPSFHANGDNKSGLPRVLDAPGEMPQPLLDLVKLASKIMQPNEADPRAVEAITKAGLLDQLQCHRKPLPPSHAAQLVQPEGTERDTNTNPQPLPLDLGTKCTCGGCTSFDEAKQLLMHIPPEVNYDLWRNIIWALSDMLNHSACGRELVVEWSESSVVAKRNDGGQAGNIYDSDQRFLDQGFAVDGQAIGSSFLTALGRACGSDAGQGYPDSLIDRVVGEHAYTLAAECGVDLVAERARRLSEVFTQTVSGSGNTVGHRDAAGDMILDRERLLPTAQAYIREHFQNATGEQVAQHYRNSFHTWNGAFYDVIPVEQLQRKIMRWLDQDCYYWTRGKSPTKRRYGSKMNYVDDVVRGLRIALSTDRDRLPPPFLLDSGKPLTGILVGKTKVIDIRTSQVLTPSPNLFATNGLPYDPDPSAPSPDQWHKFLRSMFPRDPRSIALLQEWFGYVLLGSLVAQKMLCMIGVPASGKSTLGHVMKELIGDANYTGLDLGSLVRDKKPTLASMSKKTLAVIADNRVAGHSGGVVETLLKIIGGDEVNFRGMRENDVTAVLPTRLMLMANSLPELRDDARAMRRRMLFLRFDVSFVGREDRGLLDTLKLEMPGILNWALDGARRLMQADWQFTRPDYTDAIEGEFEEGASPVRTFVEERCVLGEGQQVDCSELLNRYGSWLRTQGYPDKERLSSPQLSKALRSLGIAPATKKSGERRYYRGIGLNQLGGDSDAPL